jgi:hypothetical protein
MPGSVSKKYSAVSSDCAKEILEFRKNPIAKNNIKVIFLNEN